MWILSPPDDKDNPFWPEGKPYQETPYLSIGIWAHWYASMIHYQWYNMESDVEQVQLPVNPEQLKEKLNLDDLVAALDRAKVRVLAWTEKDLIMDD